MTREEQRRKAANKYIKDIVTPIPASLMTAFIKGAEWADANPDLYSVTRKAVEREREYLIGKVCEWLKTNYTEFLDSSRLGINIDELVKDLKNDLKQSKFGGTTLTRAEKVGYKAYPENKGYSTIGDAIYEENRRAFIGGYEQGYKDAIDKACEWLNNNILEESYLQFDEDGYPTINKESIVYDFKQAMEEQQ